MNITRISYVKINNIQIPLFIEYQDGGPEAQESQ